MLAVCLRAVIDRTYALEEIVEAAPEVVLLPDEPYAFGPPDVAELIQELQAAPGNAVLYGDLGNLYANERFWPYQIQLTSDWKPDGWEGEFGWGLGVVLRIDHEDGPFFAVTEPDIPSRGRIARKRFAHCAFPACAFQERIDIHARASLTRLVQCGAVHVNSICRVSF